ncbi:unnamed protein product, partial [Prorocentrum cordatum]
PPRPPPPPSPPSPLERAAALAMPQRRPPPRPVAIAIGMRSIGAIAVVVVLAGLALMGFKAVAARWCKKRAARAPGESSGSDGEDEERMRTSPTPSWTAPER